MQFSMPSFQVKFIHVIKMTLSCTYIGKGLPAFGAEIFSLIIYANFSFCCFFQRLTSNSKKLEEIARRLLELIIHFRVLFLHGLVHELLDRLLPAFAPSFSYRHFALFHIFFSFLPSRQQIHLHFKRIGSLSQWSSNNALCLKLCGCLNAVTF